jgi:hypothetical protein
MPYNSQGPQIETPDSPFGAEAPEHAHRWRIGEQSGPSSAGVCSCGETREFTNGWDNGPTGWMTHRAPGRVLA